MDATTPNMVANIGSCCVRVGSGVQTYATTPNNVRTCSASGTREIFLLQDSGGQFHKTFTSVIYKCSF